MVVEIEKQDAELQLKLCELQTNPSLLSTKEIDISFWKKLPTLKYPLLREFALKIIPDTRTAEGANVWTINLERPPPPWIVCRPTADNSTPSRIRFCEIAPENNIMIAQMNNAASQASNAGVVFSSEYVSYPR
ncbi:hypothetical protein QTP88_026631 [Uroleucon formosanum]